MWFRNLHVHRLPAPWKFALEDLESALAGAVLAGCGALDAQSVGWVPPRQPGAFVHPVNGCWLIALGVEQKLLPAAVVKQAANERAAEILAREGRRVGRKEMRELRERITDEFLPRAFVRRRITAAWIDPAAGWLVIDAGSAAKGEEFAEQLRKALPDIPLAPLKLAAAPSSAMTSWLVDGDPPAGFTIDQDLELASPDDARVRYVRHALEGAEIRDHIAGGKIATRLALTWRDRISFVLGDPFGVKRLAFLDILKEESEQQAENDDERFDLDFALMAGEVARLLADLVDAIGGEAAATP